MPHGLVPPPPAMPTLQSSVPRLDPNIPEVHLKTDARLKSKTKPNSNSNKKDSQASSTASNKESTPGANGPQESDPDFLIEWASVKKKPAK